MKKLLNYLPLHFVLMLMLGILFQYKYQIWGLQPIYFLLFLISVIFIILVVKRKQIRTIFSFVLFFCLGIALVYVNNDKNYPNYFEKFQNHSRLKVVKISKILKPATQTKHLPMMALISPNILRITNSTATV